MSEQMRLDFEGGRAARDAGIARVAAHSPKWFDEAMEFVRIEVPPGWIGLSEDIRFMAQGTSVGLPRHHNAWGSLAMHAAKRGYLEATGRWLPMRDVSSHGRKTPQYRRTSYGTPA